MPPTNPRVELGDLLARTVASVVRAQEELDDYAARRQRAFENAAPGELVLPPLWHTFSAVDIELELAASVSRAEAGGSGTSPRLLARTLDPTSVSLYGHAASAGLRVRVRVEPQGIVPLAGGAGDTGGPAPGGAEEAADG